MCLFKVLVVFFFGGKFSKYWYKIDNKKMYWYKYTTRQCLVKRGTFSKFISTFFY